MTAPANARNPSATRPEPTASEIQSVFVGLMIVNALGALDQSIVATALPRIVSDLGGLNHLSWVVTAYVLASTSVMPLYGKLSDHHGRKPMIYVAVLTFLGWWLLESDPAAGLIADGKAKTAEEIRELMSGNICRCGAYTNIVAAIQQAMGRS